MMKTMKTSLGYAKNLLMWGGLCVVVFLLSGCSKSDMEIDPSTWSNNVKACWPCTLYRAVFDAMGKITTQTYEMACSSAMIILALGWLFWISFKTIQMFMSFEGPNFKKFWVEDVLVVLFKVMMVAAVISAPDYIMDFLNRILTPVITVFITIARTVIFADPQMQEVLKVPQTYVESGGQLVQDYPLFSADIGAQVQDLIYRIYISLKSVMVLATHLFMQMTFMSVITAVFLWWSFFLLMIIFPFSLIEIFYKMGVVIIFAPFVLVAWVFPPTKKMTGTAWEIVIGAMIQMLVSCTFIAFMLLVLTRFTEILWPGFFSENVAATDEGLVEDMQRLSVGTLSFFFVVMFMIKFAENIVQFGVALGGSQAKSDMVNFLVGIKNLAVGAVMALAAFGAAFVPVVGTAASAALAKEAREKAQQGMKQVAEGSGNVLLDKAAQASSGGIQKMAQNATETAKKNNEKRKESKKDKPKAKPKMGGK